MAKKSTTKQTPKLSTPMGGDYDTIITKDWVGKAFVIQGVEPIKTQYGDAYILIGHAPREKKETRVLCGASVLVKTLAAFLDNGGVLPVEVTCIKPKGQRYFVFE